MLTKRGTGELLKVLFAASEGAPFVKRGGLGEVIGSLPGSFKAAGDMPEILPKVQESWDSPGN